MGAPELWIVAGPNGAGKTSCVQRRPLSEILRRPVHFLNPDDRTRLRLQEAGYSGFTDAPAQVLQAAFLASANEVYNELGDCIHQRIPAGIETVLSTDKYVSLVEYVRRENGFVGLIYVALSSSALAVQRVAVRMRQGGHGVPEDKIHQRWQKSLENLPLFARMASAFWVIDNSSPADENATLLVARGQDGLLEFIDESCFPELRSALSKLNVPII